MSEESGLARMLRSARGHVLWKVLGAYLVTSWVALQVVDFLAQNFGMPDWFPAFAVALLIIGLPIVLATAILQSGTVAAPDQAKTGGDASSGSQRTAAPSSADASREISRTSPSTAHRLFTWRNAILGGMAAFALWGVVAAVWILGGGGRVGASTDEGGAPLRTVAVLPFENLSADQENAFFADGIHEDVLTHLSKVHDLTVISRTSVLAYRGTTENLASIGSELGAGAIVEGSVRRSGDNVRITAQLIDARTDEHLWADNFDRALTAANVFAIQTEIAQRIAQALAATLSPEVEDQLERAPTANLDAYDFVLRGREAYRRYEENANNDAIRLFRAAVERDPDYAEAWAGIADAFGQRVFRYGYGLEWADSAEMAANRAVELEPTLASGHKALALSFSARGFVQRSIDENRRALELDPNYADAMNNVAVDLATKGSLAEAHRWYRRSFRLQPNLAFARANLAASYAALGELAISRRRLEEAITLDPADVTPRAYLLGVLSWEGKIDDAADLAEALVQDYPDMPFALNAAAVPLLFAHRWQRALELSTRSLELSPDQDLTGWHHPRDIASLALDRMGQSSEAHRRLRESASAFRRDLDRTREIPHIPFQLAAIYATLGEPQEALDWLETAYEAGFRGIHELRTSPFFDGLRDDPRFVSILEEMEADVERMRLEIEREELAAGDR